MANLYPVNKKTKEREGLDISNFVMITQAS